MSDNRSDIREQQADSQEEYGFNADSGHWEPIGVRVYDAGAEYGDRFTAVFPDGEMLGIGATGNTPNGFCQHVGNVSNPAYREGLTLGEPVAFGKLPEPVQRAIRQEVAR